MLIVRASDGASWTLYRQDFAGISTLAELRFNLLSPLLSIPPDCLICMNEEGAQLREDSVPLLGILAGSPSVSPLLSTSQAKARGLSEGGLDASGGGSGRGSIVRRRPRSPSATGLERERERRLYIFDREHLDADPEEVAFALSITEDQVLLEPELGPEDPLPSHISLSQHNLATLHALLSSLSLQRDSLSLALSNLQRVMTGTSTSLAIFLESNSAALEGWEELLQGWEGNMEAITKISVVNGLLSSRVITGVGASLTAGNGAVPVKERERFLGDYVSREKMTTVRDGCAKVLEELQDRLKLLRETLADVLEGTAVMKREFEETSLADLEACEHDAEDGHAKTTELVTIALDLNDPRLRAENFEELFHLDQDARDRIRFLVDRKNAVTRYLVLSMQRISTLQSSIASMPTDLSALDHDLRTRTDNFKHLARLDGMIPAYIATVVEVVRRRAYARLTAAHADSVASSLMPIPSIETARRIAYRASFAGKLPWEVKGLGGGTEENLPSIGFVGGAQEFLPELDRPALIGLRDNFAQLVDTLVAGIGEGGPIKRAGAMLADLIQELDGLEGDFERAALGKPQVVSTEEDLLKISTLEQRVRAAEEANEALSRQLQSERTVHEEESAQLNQRTAELLASKQVEEGRVADYKQEVLVLTRHQTEAAKREIGWAKERLEWEKRSGEDKASLGEVVKKAQTSEDDSRRKLHELEAHLNHARTSAQESATSMRSLEAIHLSLQTSHTTLQESLTRSNHSLNDVTERLATTEAELREAAMLILQKDRALRDFKNENDLDHASIEQEVKELKNVVKSKEEEVVLGAKESLRLEAIVSGLEDKLNVLEGSLLRSSTSLASEKRARVEIEGSLVEGQIETRRLTETARKALKVAGELRDENLKIVAALSATTPPVVKVVTPDEVSSTTTPIVANVPPVLAPSPDFEHGDLLDLLTTVQKFERAALTQAVKVKVDSLTILTHKWQKECKAYRERAHRATSGASEKIAFRNFAKGDLALFLPTRNSTAPVCWAAFNVSFPHHFLSATGVIGEQIKSREWIVARIVSLEEKIADAKDASSNPFQLNPGTKFFLLEVEGWSSKDESRARVRKASTGGEKIKSRGGVVGEERRPSGGGGGGHSRGSKSESGPRAVSAPLAGPAGTTFTSTTLDAAPLLGTGMQSSTFDPARNGTDLARSEFTIIPKETSPTSPVLGPTPPNSTSLPIALSSPHEEIPTSPNLARSDPFTSPFGTMALPPTSSIPRKSSLVIASLFDPLPPISLQATPAFLPSNLSKQKRYPTSTLQPRSKSLSTSTSPPSSQTSPSAPPLPLGIVVPSRSLSSTPDHHHTTTFLSQLPQSQYNKTSSLHSTRSNASNGPTLPKKGNATVSTDSTTVKGGASAREEGNDLFRNGTAAVGGGGSGGGGITEFGASEILKRFTTR